MGCSGSKVDDLPLVVRCRERRDLVRDAANHRYALAAAHVSYFKSLKDVGDALRKFVDEELVTTTSGSSSSSFSSPSLTLPSNSKKKHESNTHESPLHLHDDDGESHLNISDTSSEDADSDQDHHHHHHHHLHTPEDDAHRHHKGKGFGDEANPSINEEELSFHYPGGYSGYGNGYGPGFANYPFPNPYPYSYPDPSLRPYGEPYMDQWNPPPPGYQSNNPNVYYMKKSAPAAKTVVQEPPGVSSQVQSDMYWNPAAVYGGNYGYFPTGSSMNTGNNVGVKLNPQKEVPPPPSPKVSAWDFFNPFDVVENGYPGYYSTERYENGSKTSSSPDSSEVREMEGIPDLEEDTESEVVYKEVHKGEGVKSEAKRNSRGSAGRKAGNGGSRAFPQRKGEGSLRSVPLHKGEGSLRPNPVRESESSSRSLPSWSSDEIPRPPMAPQNNRESVKASVPSEGSVKPPMSPLHRKGTTPVVDGSPNDGISSSISLTDDKSSPEIVLKSVVEDSVKKKGVTFDVEGTSKQEIESSSLSSLSLLSPHGNRNLQEVVAEITDEFETASAYGKEVAIMLEVGKLPYQPSFLKVIVSRILCLLSPSLSPPDPPPTKSRKSVTSTMKLSRSYFEDIGKDVSSRAFNLSATLDELYAWEKKLYKEVKDEERLRVTYEKLCKKIKSLDQAGAESTKIDAARASSIKLLTKLDVSVKAIDAISTRIHKLRDEELQPQVAALIHGLIRMWKAMLKCHKKQFHAIMESKMRKLKAKTALQVDTSSNATTQLERELRAWCDRFNDWVKFQKSYVESLNGWLMQCLQYEPEQTPDGPVPYSPGRLGAPPIFIICNDWQQAMEAISEAMVSNAMNSFATSLRQLWEKQDEEGRQRLKAEYLSKDYEKQLQTHYKEKGTTRIDHEDANSDKTGLSMVTSDSGAGASPLHDLKVDLDSMKHKLAEERLKHKDAMKLVHEAASSSLQGGLVPIFKALENFTSEALKAHEHVRLKHPGKSS